MQRDVSDLPTMNEINKMLTIAGIRYFDNRVFAVSVWSYKIFCPENNSLYIWTEETTGYFVPEVSSYRLYRMLRIDLTDLSVEVIESCTADTDFYGTVYYSRGDKLEAKVKSVLAEYYKVDLRDIQLCFSMRDITRRNTYRYSDYYNVDAYVAGYYKLTDLDALRRLQEQYALQSESTGWCSEGVVCS